MVGMLRTRRRKSSEEGFTLIELMIVIVIIGILASIAIPNYIKMVKRANEAVLRTDLQVMRQAIDSYTADKEKAPDSLDDLVQAGYLREVPVDPVTHAKDTWITDQSDTMMDINQTAGGIDNVHSGAQTLASDGTSYSTW
ncbi:MAG: prepilin-type N-terminal cleavage/methylation domain-containing protein [Bryocella sp.]